MRLSLFSLHSIAHKHWLALGLCMSVAGCVAIAEGGKTTEPTKDNPDGSGNNNNNDNDDNDNVSQTDLALRARCRESTEKSKTVLATYCVSCHGAGASNSGGFQSVTDLNAMVDQGKVVAGQPDSSPIYTSMKSGAMPPASASAQPSDKEIAYIHDWIACGAPAQARAADAPTFVSIDERLQSMVADLRTFEAPADRKNVRYVDLYNLSNAGFSEAELDVYREAVSFLLNSLSNGRRVVTPQRVDDRGLLFRVELDDYGWSAAKWATIVEKYPYAVQYNEDSRLFPVDEVSAEQVRKETGEPIAYVQGDWLISNCIRPPLYYDVLDTPTTMSGLEQKLNVDIAQDVKDGEAVRIGFRHATGSQNDAVLERHELSGGAGSLWVRYDFANGLESSDVFAHPLDFTQDAMQVAYTLPNGLMGYMITDGSGKRIDKAPNDTAQDPASRDGAAEAGVSCMSCHGDQAIAAKADEVRDAIKATGNSAQEIADVLALYADKTTTDKLYAKDQAIYGSARTSAALKALKNGSMHQIDDRHLDVLNLSEVAAVLGVTDEQLQRALDAGPQEFPASLRALRTDGGEVPRDGFEAAFGPLVTALGLGKPYQRDDLLNGNGSSGGDGDSTGSGDVDAGSPGGDVDSGTGAGDVDAGTPEVDAGSGGYHHY
jgi:mono/diheme cytochrome c family protein